MLTEQTLQGVIVPIVTPFNQRGNLDVKSFKELVKRLVSKGIHGLVVNGTTGESPTVEETELETLISTARNEMGEIPLIVGTGSNNTVATVKKNTWVKSLGADAALVVTPYYNRPSQQGIIQHFQALAEADLPIILYDIPHRTGVSLELETVKAIMGMDHVIGLKESSGNIKRAFKLARSLTKPVLCGEDELFFASLCCGGKGGILASANLDSDQFVQVYELFRAGKIEESSQRFDQLLPLIQFLFSEPNPAPLKWLLAERGHIRSDRLRLPMTSISSETAKKGVQLL
ncbi:4-hydroxy-tetrahydrodipicolinate synthase [Paenibacillus solisilvae]|uniref:4-hydroxy-tetrahydrodipicolinate synthase n=1 Tax=Paenibacillus solisilvae TaxID=2486751 RepID=A0ABW0VU07_9BACL